MAMAVGMVVPGMVMPLMPFGLRLFGRFRVDLSQAFALGLFIRFQMALLVLFAGTARTIVVAPGLQPCLPVLIRHNLAPSFNSSLFFGTALGRVLGPFGFQRLEIQEIGIIAFEIIKSAVGPEFKNPVGDLGDKVLVMT